MTAPAVPDGPAAAPSDARAAAADAEATAAEKSPKKRRRWRRLIVVVCIVIIAVSLAMRVIIIFAFPSVLKKVAASYDLNATYDRMELYLLGSDVGLYHLKLTPKAGGDALVDLEYCRADVSALDLLRGKLLARRVEADGATMRIEREADGSIPALQKLLAGGATTKPTEPFQLTSLDSPLQLDALRLNHIRTQWRDRSVTPPVETELEMTMRISDLGSADRPTRFLLDMTSPPLLDSLRVEGKGTARGQAMDATLTVIARGIHPKPATGYLAPLGFRPIADDINVLCTATVKTHATGGPAAATTSTNINAPAKATTQPADIAGEVTIENIVVRTDGREAAGVDRVAVKVDRFNGNALQLASVLVDGVRATAERTAAGNMRVAGLEMVPASAATVTTRPSAAPASPPTAVATAAPSMRIALADFTVRNVRASFSDASVAPPANLSFLVNSLSARNIIADPSRPDAAVTIAGDFAAPGIARTIRLSGTALPFAPVRTLNAKLVAQGVRPEAIRAYLDAAGVESTMKDATATCDISASVAQTPSGGMRGDVVAQNIRLSDGTELFAFDAAKLSGFSVNPNDGGIRIDAIDLSGPRLGLTRDADGSVQTLGFRTKAPTTKPASNVTVAAATPAPTTAPAAAAPSPLPQLEIGRLTWKGVALDLNDRAITPSTAMKITDAGIELANVRIGGADAGNAARPGRIKAWFAAPGVMKQLTVDGTVVPSAHGATADLSISGNGLNGELLAPYLKAAGVEPTLRNGSLSLRTRANVSSAPGGPIRAALALEKVRYLEGGQELLGVDRLAVDGVELRNDGVTVATVQVDQPRAHVARDADGSLHLAGVRIAPPATQPASADSSIAAAPVPTTKAAPTTSPSSAYVATLRKLRVNGATLAWTDRAVQPSVDAVAHSDVELDEVVLGGAAHPAKLKITTKIDQTLDNLAVAGAVAPDPKTPQAHLEIAASGVRAGALAPYLPPGVRGALIDGRFKTTIDAAAAPHPQGGRSARLAVSGLDYREHDAQQALIHFDDAKVIVSRADVPGGVVAIEEVSLSGLETELRKDKDQSMKVLGLAIGAAPLSSPSPQAQPQLAGDKQPADMKPVAAAAASPTTGPTDANKLIAREQLGQLPLVTLDKLDIQLKHIAYIDESQPDATPLALADVRLRNPKRIEVLGRDSTSRPPIELELIGRIEPVVNRFTVGIESAPFAAPATLQVKFAADGIRGNGITDVLPALRDKIDGSALTDGRFAANVEAQAKIERHGPTKLDLSKPFEATFSLRDVAFREKPDGPVVLGLEEIHAEPIRVDPRSGSVAIRTLEINKPTARAVRDKDGIHALGLLLREQPAATQPAADSPATQPTPPPSEAVMASSSQSPTTAPAVVKPTAEYRIDKLVVSGIDVAVEDRSVSPPLVAPLNSLEVEVRDLSNMALYEDRPIRFNLTAGAGKVPLKEGVERELFSEVAAAGTMSLYPTPHGWARSSVSGLELRGLRGPAAEKKVNIEGGVFDSNVDVRIASDGTLDTRSRFAFSDLRMNEPSDGFVRRVLKLPGPLDAVIIVLQDPSGAITVPLNVKVENGTVSGGQIAGAAVTALGSIITTAMASAPLKAAGGVTELVGLDQAIPLLGKKHKQAGPQRAGTVAFAPGVTDPIQRSDLDALVRRMQKDRTLQVTLRHEIGDGDVVLAAARANPPQDQCFAMAAQLRQRKAELLASRPAVAAAARAQLLAQPQSAEDPLLALRNLDRQIGAAEEGLDRLYELLRPGADRQADRRTRAACLQLAEQRLAMLNQMLASSGIPDANQRVHVIKPTSAAVTEADAGGGGSNGGGAVLAGGAGGGGHVSMVVVSKKKM